MEQLLVPKPLCWSCLEQEAVTGGIGIKSQSFTSQHGGKLGRSSRVQVYQTWDLTGFYMSARPGNVILL